MSLLAFRKKSVSVTTISNVPATSAYVNRLNLWHFIQFCIPDQQHTNNCCATMWTSHRTRLPGKWYRFWHCDRCSVTFRGLSPRTEYLTSEPAVKIYYWVTATQTLECGDKDKNRYVNNAWIPRVLLHAIQIEIRRTMGLISTKRLRIKVLQYQLRWGIH